MVTKTKAPAAKRSATRKRVAVAVPPAEAAPETEKPNLIRAGLQALDKARQDVAQRQSRVFEAILGLEPAQGLTGLVGREGGAAAKVAAEAFGLRKFEAVFDQRVAHALERMGAPSPQALQALVDEVAALKEEVRSLKAATRRR
jgi:hypothetical protein